MTPPILPVYNIAMPTQYEFDFEQDVNVKGELFFEKKLTDPCDWCNEREAEITITRVRTGKDFGICNNCAEDDYIDWHEQMSDR